MTGGCSRTEPPLFSCWWSLRIRTHPVPFQLLILIDWILAADLLLCLLTWMYVFWHARPPQFDQTQVLHLQVCEAVYHF